jgi:hypothetical protein
MLISSVLNALTSSTKVDTVLRLQKPSAALCLLHDKLAPEALRVALSPVFTRLRRTEAQNAPPWSEAGDPIIDRLQKLADLLDRGAITQD